MRSVRRRRSITAAVEQIMNKHLHSLSIAFLCVLSCDNGTMSETVSTEDHGASTTGDAVAAGELCSSFTDADGCQSADAPSGYVCQWVNVLRTERVLDMCVGGSETRCLAFEDHGVPPACVASIPGCDPASDPERNIMPIPVYREAGDGTFEIFNQCGNFVVVGFSDCNSGTASDANPPVCACACELAL